MRTLTLCDPPEEGWRYALPNPASVRPTDYADPGEILCSCGRWIDIPLSGPTVCEPGCGAEIRR